MTFFGAEKQNWVNSTRDPLLHQYLQNDPKFQQWYVAFAKAIAHELDRRNLDNTSIQSVNEPRFCRGGQGPTPQLLASWESLERKIFDGVRSVSPKMGLVSSAICTAGDQFFSGMHNYSEIGAVLPIHKGLQNVTYAIHFRNPRLLMIGASAMNLKQGTVVHYPYASVSIANAGDKGANWEIGVYNKEKPSAQFYERAFGDLGAFAKAKKIRIMASEFDIVQPEFGLPRQDRINFTHDFVDASRRHSVPIVYMGVFDTVGLSSCLHDKSIPDHRFDQTMMKLFAWGNGVADVPANLTVEQQDPQCAR